MKYFLDTNICIYLINQKPKHVLERLQTIDPYDIVLSSIVVSELEYGVAKSMQRVKNSQRLEKFISGFTIANYDRAAAKQYGDLRTTLERSGQLIGPQDMFIAAHALSLNLPLVTNNEREFRRVQGLRVENWV